MAGQSRKREFHWPSVLWYIHLYILGTYGLYEFLFVSTWPTFLFAIFIITLGTLGITIGAHRLWAHQTYEASSLVKLILMLSHTLTGVESIYDWVLAHRIHHKYYGTEQDPYNHNKGFLFSHIMTNVMRPPTDWEKTVKSIDLRDIENDRFVWFQKRFYWFFFIIFGLLLPINTPAEYWGESISNTVFVLGFFRLFVLSNISWLVNSAMYIWGLKPQDKFPPDDNSVFIVTKSFWLNYHYLFPWDWKTDEFGGYEGGFTNIVLKTLENIGLVTGMKTASNEAIRDALYNAALDKKRTVEQVFKEVEKVAEYETAQVKLRYRH